MLNGAQSSWLPITSDVPHCTVLGPRLFLLYISNIVSNIHSAIRLFADDCILYHTVKISDCLILQEDINKLYQSNGCKVGKWALMQENATC